MPSLLFECFSEEIPARMQARAVQDLQRLFEEAMQAEGLAHGTLTTYVTPRRLALACADIAASQPGSATEKKGPRVGAPQAAIDGFSKSAGVAVPALERRMVGKEECFYAVIERKGRNTPEVLKPLFEKILAQFPWPKSMRWGSNQKSWVRPLHSLLCVFGGEVVPVAFAGVTASNITYGHRFLAPGAITVNTPEDYAPKLKKAYVLADREERKAEIVKSTGALAASQNLRVKPDQGLLEEVTGLVEWPNPLMGTIDDAFMDLPPEVLTSEMRAHQKYFALLPQAQ